METAKEEVLLPMLHPHCLLLDFADYLEVWDLYYILLILLGMTFPQH